MSLSFAAANNTGGDKSQLLVLIYICNPRIRVVTPQKAGHLFRMIVYFRVVAQPGSALVWGARGRWFESSPPDTFRRP